MAIITKLKELMEAPGGELEILEEVVRGGWRFVVNDDDIDMRKKNKKMGKDARARAEGYQISP